MEKNVAAQCEGSHRFFVADVAVIEDEGRVCILVVCTSCGDAQCKDFQVTKTGHKVRLEKQQKENNNESI
jgi:hypothetical protein